MPSLNSSLNMGQRALSMNQRAMHTSGHNIANQQTEGFSRQQVTTQSAPADPLGLGRGAEAQPTTRVFDHFIQKKILQENPRTGVFHTREDYLNKIEMLLNELEGNGLNQAMNDYWNAWSQLSSQPESDAARSQLREVGDVLARRFRELHGRFTELRHEINGRLQQTINQINELGLKITEFNRQILTYESGQRNANDLRDARDQAIEELSKLVDVNPYEDRNGNVTVIIGRDWTLVQSRNFFPLEASMKGGETGMMSIDGVATHDSRRDLTQIFREGEMTELLRMRDETIVDYMHQIDELAFSIAGEVNRLHATGTGLNSSVDMMKSTFGLRHQAMNEPLPFIRDGIFQLHLVDRDNEILETYEVEIQAGADTLPDIVSRINLTVNDPQLLNATLEEDGSMILQSGDNRRFIFGEDQTGVTQVLGLNGFFETLKGAEDIRLSDTIQKHPNHISSGRDLIPGDNRTALEIAKLPTKPIMRDGTMTFGEFFSSIITDLGLKVRRNQSEMKQQDNMIQQFKEIRSSISSVNMDEELTNMVQYQKAYEASARFLGTVDEMMETVINMK